eukprot:TRINITY_DN12758_c0_g1_i2.p1 TRINITY_DN12758_c0_g1~~TRINITY_DN12758_c0_g1_i2.p1  ORF type:complete len:296 (-),score=62.12 TRINITY_DN12758_c0_g1_i2:36-923(-)
MPRAEVDRISDAVRACAAKIRVPGRAYPCGSYRRGNPTCQDLDLVFCFEGAEDDYESSSERLVSALRSAGIWVADLSCPGEPGHLSRSRSFPLAPQGEEPPGTRVYLGVVRGFPSEGEQARCRRVDLIFCTRESLAFVLFQWTGSGLFNREMKRLAALRGLHLSTTYACRAERSGVRGQNVGEAHRFGPCIPCADEHAIFKLLRFPYRAPECRNVDAEVLEVIAEAAREAPSVMLAAKAEFAAKTEDMECKAELLGEGRMSGEYSAAPMPAVGGRAASAVVLDLDCDAEDVVCIA